jgi:Holliday junction resolvase RusA-like endonuclease
MSNYVQFTIAGEPKGKGRPKFSTINGHAQAITPERTVIYENLVKTMYAANCGNFKFPDDAQLDMSIIAYFAIPKSASKKKRQDMQDGKIRPTKKPDMDNIIKIIADALNQIAYKDDSQIVDTTIQKYYSDNPRVIVMIKEAEFTWQT